MRRNIELVAIIAERAVQARYRGSIVGVYWSLGNPLLVTAVYTVLFSSAFSRYYSNSQAQYALAVFVGLTLLSFFSGATTQGVGSVVGAAGLLSKVRLPAAIFPLGAVAANLVQLVVGTLPILIAVTLWRTHDPLHVVALAVPLTGLVMTAAGFALALSALFVSYRDVSHLYEVFVFLLSLSAPIFYPAALVPDRIRPFVQLNPLATVVEGVRTIALTPGLIPWWALVVPLISGALVLALGTAVFTSLRRGFADLL